MVLCNFLIEFSSAWKTEELAFWEYAEVISLLLVCVSIVMTDLHKNGYALEKK